MSGKLHLICKGVNAKIRCNLNDISYLSETQLSILIITTSLVLLSPKYFIIMFSLKLHSQLWQLITFCALGYDVHYDAYIDVLTLKKTRW